MADTFIQNDTLTVGDKTYQSDAFVKMLQIFGIEKLTITSAQIEPDGNGSLNFTVTGGTQLFSQDVADLELYLDFTSDQNFEFQLTGTVASLTLSALGAKGIFPSSQISEIAELLSAPFDGVQFSFDSETTELYFSRLDSAAKLTLLEAIGLSLDKIGFEFIRTYSDNSMGLVVHAQIIIGSAHINAQITIPLGGSLDPGNWVLTIDSTIILSSGLQDLITFLDRTDLVQRRGLPSFANVFPPQLKDIPVLFLDEICILMDPVKKQFQFLTFRVVSVESIALVDNLKIDKVGVRMSITPQAGAAGIALFIFGSVQMGKTSSLDVSVMLPEDFLKNNWIFSMSGNVDLQSINDIELLPIKTPVGDLKLPPSFFKFKFEALKLNLFEVDFNPNQATISTISLNVAIIGECDLIHDLAFKNPAMMLDIADPFNPTRNLSGAFSGVIQVGDINFDIAADKQATGWDFTGSTEPGAILIGTLIDSMSKKFNLTLPDFVNSITLESLSLNFSTTTDTADSSQGTADPANSSQSTPNAASKSETVSFKCEGKFPIDDEQADLALTVDVSSSTTGGSTGGSTDSTASSSASGTTGNSYSAQLGGTLTISQLVFTAHYSQDPTKNFFAATYSHKSTQPGIKLKDLIAGASSTVAKYIPESLEVDLKDVLFAFSKDAAGSRFLFGLDLGTSINLSELPLVGQVLPADVAIGVKDLQVLVASQLFDQTLVAALKGSFQGISITLPDGNLNAGLKVSASMNFGKTALPLDLPVSGGAAPNPATTSPATTAAAPPNVASSDNAKWFTLQKSFGPVSFKRVGVQYQDGVLAFLLDASLSVAGLTLSLDGLLVGSPLNKFDPRFNLRGIGIDYLSGPVSIGAAFLRKQVITDRKTYDEYDGAALIKMEQLTLSAIGSYAYLNGHPSLFVYAVLDYPLGGPSFFFITGLAAGFGYNRSLIMPTIDRVAQFPLVEEAINGAGSPKDAGAELQKIHQYIPPSTGDIFFAVGIKFTSFKLIDSFLLLTVSFGHRFEINLLGLSNLIVPPQVSPQAGQAVPPLAVVQMAIEATFLPDEGFLGVLGQLTSASYILSRDCHLTGGFAFYSWFSGPHAGDFVQTLGGYHPSFKIPDHYPRVPRLGMNWRVDGNLSIKGGAYCALTSSALMAGGSLQATWQSGSFKAWFNAAADFIIAWKPYHYDASVSVSMGAAYTFKVAGVRKTISAHVGADLHIWGPEFSGKAHVKLKIVSFNVTFGGAKKSPPQAINWSEFKTSFLPEEDKVCTVAVKAGLVKQSGDGKWIINPRDFCLALDSAIPSKEAAKRNTLAAVARQDTPIPSQHQTVFGIGPMEVSADDLSSRYYITLIRNNSEWAGDDFEYVPILKKVPAGLWGQSLAPSLNGQAFIEQALTGFEIRPGNGPTPGATSPIKRANLQRDATTIPDAYKWEAHRAFASSSGKDGQRREVIRTTIAETTVAGKRQRLLSVLGVCAEITLGADVADAFLIAPDVGTLAS